jgi:hypothetical protein
LKKLLIPFVAACTVALSFAGSLAAPAAAQDKAPAPAAVPPADQAVIDVQLPSYPRMVCPIGGEALGAAGKPVNIVREGRLIRLCCDQCVKDVDKDVPAVVAKIDAAVIAEQGPSYPLATCAVCDGKVTEPVAVVVGTRLVRLCSAECKAPLLKNPAASMAKIDAALIEAQKKTYKVEVCPVSGEKLGSMGEPIDHLAGTRLVRLCCKGCVKTVKKDPAGVLSKLDTLAAATK